MLVLLPNIGSLSDMTSSAIVEAYIKPAEAEINARIARAYTVPVSGSIPMLEAIATDMSIHRALTLRVFTAAMLKESAWPKQYERAIETLKEIAAGKLLLVDSAGVIVGERAGTSAAYSNTMDYQPTYHEGGGWNDQVKDTEKNDDLLNDRDLQIWP